MQAEKGTVVFLTLVIMTALLAVGVGLSSLLVGELQQFRRTEDSVFAFAAADAGAERVMYAHGVLCYIVPTNAAFIVSCLQGNTPNETLDNGAEYTITVEAGGSGSCPAGNTYCATSEGEYTGPLTGTALREVEITR